MLTAVLAAIDEANSGDPFELTIGGRTGPKELLHAERVTEWVTRLDPGAEPVQLVAARAHHFRRWTRPRSDYPEGRAGYRRWRKDAAAAQGAEVGTILRSHGADPAFVDRVRAIIAKEGLGEDPVVQTHEDALCLVFLETQLDDLIDSLGTEHATSVVTRTIPKMSARALAAATEVALSDRGAIVLKAASDAVKAKSPQ